LLRQGGYGFLARGEVPLSGEERFLEGLNLQGLTIYDIGGFEGLYTLFFARAVGPSGRVICFEPIPGSRQRILANLRANGFNDRVQVEPRALGASEDVLTFMVPRALRGSATGSLEIQKHYARDSRGTMLRVPVVPLDSYAQSLPKPDLLKIDVEGMEVDVIRGATNTLRTHRPALFIETHGPTRETATTFPLLRELGDLGYQVIHAETGKSLTVETVPTSGSVHLYCVPQ
jgi:FkbM family methyltransferase